MDIATDKAWLMFGNCLERMDELIAMGIKVDAIICDPPYGTTSNKWDSVLPTHIMWPKLNKLIKDNGAIVLFGNEPFSSTLRVSNSKHYKYDWIWKKSGHSNPFLAKKQPLRIYENIMVFYKKPPTYNYEIKKINKIAKGCTSENYDISDRPSHYLQEQTGHPKNIIEFNHCKTKVHPTQKPTALMEYLIKTYTHEGQTVLDFTMGSGSTGVACVNTKRAFIGMEMDSKYYGIACGRVMEASAIC